MAAYTVVVKLKDAFKALNISMAANPVGLWVAGIAALVTALIWAWNNVDWFRNGIITAWNWIKTASLWTWDILKMVFSGIGTWAVRMWENGIKPVFGFFASAWDWIVEATTLTFDAVLRPLAGGSSRLAVS